MGIFPKIENGAVVVRDADGDCLVPINTFNAYCPPEGFTTTCVITALPEDCTGRIVPSQVNAIVSELLCLGNTLDPDGEWDCDSNCNLATLFAAWHVDTTPHGDGITIEGDGSPGNLLRIIPTGTVDALCADADAHDALAQCLISANANNLIIQGTDDSLLAVINHSTLLSGAGTVASPLTIALANLTTALVADPYGDTIASAMKSTDAINVISIGTDGRLKVDLTQDATITGEGTPASPLKVAPAAIVSTDAGNLVTTGTDGKLLVGAASLTTLQWSIRVGVGQVYLVDTSKTGAEIPPSSMAAGDPVFIELTAGLTGVGAFNNGKISTETVSGSAPLVLATGLISLASSPMVGQTIDFLNTESRGLRPTTTPGTKQTDALQNLTGQFSIRRVAGSLNMIGSLSGVFSDGGTTGASASVATDASIALSLINFSFATASGARTDVETRSKNLNVKAYMRIR